MNFKILLIGAGIRKRIVFFIDCSSCSYFLNWSIEKSIVTCTHHNKTNIFNIPEITTILNQFNFYFDFSFQFLAQYLLCTLHHRNEWFSLKLNFVFHFYFSFNFWMLGKCRSHSIDSLLFIIFEDYLNEKLRNLKYCV